MKNIIEPVVTEKSIDLSGKDKYVFKVAKSANRNEIKKEVEKTFKVNVIDVNILNQKGKIKKRGKIVGRTKDIKKAIVTLKKGQKIKELEVK
ncbi:MAG: 50S ribosomal protein L23 [Candidatus Berkelbacteria bacterium]|nr:50S ribosomal protein L23 [Candidatus Berkelbacteria bacterium]